jgi:hypothetical protein
MSPVRGNLAGTEVVLRGTEHKRSLTSALGAPNVNPSETLDELPQMHTHGVAATVLARRPKLLELQVSASVLEKRRWIEERGILRSHIGTVEGHCGLIDLLVGPVQWVEFPLGCVQETGLK